MINDSSSAVKLVGKTFAGQKIKIQVFSL